MTNAFVTLQSGNALIRVPVASIRYLESRRHYLMIYTACGTFRIRGRISEWAERLSRSGFVRTHRCYVVNRAAVVVVRHDGVEHTGGTRVPIGRRYRAGLSIP